MSTAKFETIQTQGGLLSLEYLHAIAKMDAPTQESGGYQVPAGLELRGEISRAWTIARALIAEQSDGKIDGQQFAVKFLTDVLRFDDIKPVRRRTSDEHPPTHTAKDDAVAIVIASAGDGLDKRQEGLLEGRRIAPFDLAQIHLNNSEKHLWGIATDGATLRLLRDSASMTQAAFIEADLTRMLSEGGEGHYSDFRALYLLAHASRFLPAENCILERWREDAVQTGIRAHKHLRNGVEKALQALGTGFLRHEKNAALRAKFPQSGSVNAFYHEILWLAYRLIFLLVIEDRGLSQTPQASEQQRQAYRHGYGISRLRERATRPHIADNFGDLWEGLKYTFTALSGESNPLALPALGGLFEADKCPDLSDCQLSNRFLLRAIYHLSYFKEGNITQRVNYRDMGADELGSIYESLLGLTPRRDVDNNFSFFNPDDKEGIAPDGKASSSYYTSPPLVEELINSALQPALENINSEQDLLSLRVVDPACGSGHFLIAAARKMAAKLAEMRGTEEEKADAESTLTTQTRQRQALRDVISHCICGVDKNPMALNLAKIALWLEAYDSGKPLTFLDHHLQCGDALLGVLNLDLLEKGIPDEAYKHALGDDKKLCASLKQSNKNERKRSNTSNLFAAHNVKELAAMAARIEEMPEDNLSQVMDKRTAQKELEIKQRDAGIHLAADMYVAAFLMRKAPEEPTPPTSSDLFNALEGAPLDNAITDAARRCAKQNGVFHWWLRYPAAHEKGGFDVVLANPPWKRAKLSKLEFFARRVPEIANAATTSERNRLIAQLGKEESDANGQAIKLDYEAALRAADTAIRYYLNSGNYPLTGKGDVNSYALFSELCLRLAEGGSAGIIVPIGIATDYNTKDFFAHLLKSELLHSLFDFENRKGLFPSVDSRFRFCLLTIAKYDNPTFSCFAHSTADLRDNRRRISLTREQLELINPNTRNMPLYRATGDCELTEKIYRTAPILWRDEYEHGGESNPWQVKFQSMFHMSNDSGLFNSDKDEPKVRLYEAKYIHQYDHRFSGDNQEVSTGNKQDASFTVNTRYSVSEQIMLGRVAAVRKTVPAKLRQALDSGKLDANAVVSDWIAGYYLNSAEPQTVQLPDFLFQYKDRINHEEAIKYYAEVPLSEEDIWQFLHADNLLELLRTRAPGWLLCWRKITNATNEMTLISSILPLTAAGHSLEVIHGELSAARICVFQAILDSLLMNYVAAQKLSGTNLSSYLIKQLPILPPEEFAEGDLKAIVPLVLELTYTANDLKRFYDDVVAEDSAYDPRPKAEHGKPYQWDESRRADLRAEIDARIALKYNITRDELRYILDPAEVMGADYPSETFRILQKNEIKNFGEYRTRRLVLAAYDKLTQTT